MKKKLLILLVSLFVSWNTAFSTDYFLDHTATESTGTTWADAYTSVANAIAGSWGAGDRLFMVKTHTETPGTDTTWSNGSIGSPCELYCVDDAIETDPTLMVFTQQTGAAFDSTKDWKFTGSWYVYGAVFNTDDSMRFGVDTTNGMLVFENCVMTITASPALEGIFFGSTGSTTFNHTTRIIDTDIEFGGSSQGFAPTGGANFLWDGGSLLTQNVSTLIEDPTRSAKVHIRNVDLSVLSGSIVNAADLDDGGNISVEVDRCKLHTDTTLLSGSIAGPGNNRVTMHRCDSANNTYAFAEESYEGRAEDDTSVYLNGTDGVQGISIKMSPNTNTSLALPLVSTPITQYTDSTTSTIFTIEVALDYATTLQDDEIWLELVYPGPDAKGLKLNDRVDVLAASANQTTSSASWTGTGGFSNLQRLSLSVTVTPGKAGPVTGRVYFAVPSGTVSEIYIDPYITES